MEGGGHKGKMRSGEADILVSEPLMLNSSRVFLGWDPQGALLTYWEIRSNPGIVKMMLIMLCKLNNDSSVGNYGH